MSKIQPITDWTPAGRRELLTREEPAIRALLEVAFTDYADRHDLAPFGFHAADPVLEAVDDSVAKFASDRVLDPRHLELQHRSFRLFTRPEWWLAWKVGRRAFDRIKRQQKRLGEGGGAPATAAVPPGASQERDAALSDFAVRVSSTLSLLFERTCADIVGLWLESTAALRHQWFGDGRRGTVSPAGRPGSAKTMSFRLHDARFRFAGLHSDLVDDASGGGAGEATGAVAHTMFSPCANAPPYRVPDAEVASTWSAEGRPTSTRQVGDLRKRGAALIVRGLCERLAGIPVSTQGRLDWVLLRGGVAPTTLHTLGLGERAELRQLVADLRSIDQFKEDLA